MTYFIHDFLTNKFRSLLQPSSGWCYYYKNTKVQMRKYIINTVVCFIGYLYIMDQVYLFCIPSILTQNNVYYEADLHANSWLSINETHNRRIKTGKCPTYLWGDGGDPPPCSNAVYQAQLSLPVHTVWTLSPKPQVQVQVQLLVNTILDPHCSPSQVLVDVLPEHTNTSTKRMAIFSLTYSTVTLQKLCYFQHTSSWKLTFIIIKFNCNGKHSQYSK